MNIGSETPLTTVPETKLVLPKREVKKDESVNRTAELPELKATLPKVEVTAVESDNITPKLPEIKAALPKPEVKKVESVITPPQFPKTKVKTRPANVSKNATQEPASTAEEQRDTPTSIVIKPKSLKVFSFLLFDPDNAKQPGGISWHDFLGAMEDAGFSFQKQYGSAWLFSHVKFGPAPNLNLHDRHGAKIPLFIARGIRRRLTKRYGWTTETFVVQK